MLYGYHSIAVLKKYQVTELDILCPGYRKKFWD